MIFEVNAGCTRFDHALHEFERIQRSAETSFGIGHQRRKPRLARCDFAFCVMNLIRTLQGAVDTPANIRDAVRRIKTLIRIRLTSQIGIRCHLPT